MLFYKKYIPDITDEQQSVIYKKAILESPKAKEYSGMSDLIKKCKTEKKRLFVVSSDHPETLLPEIQSFGLDGVFSEVIFGVYDKEEGVLKIIQDNNLKKDETVFIGDSNHEIEVGQKVGIKTIAVTWGFSSEIKLQSKNPDYLVHSVEELEKIIL